VFAVPVVAAQNELDQVIWADYVRLRNQLEVAQLHGDDQTTVSRAVARYVDSIPPAEKREKRERALDRLEELYQAHRERARTSIKAASMVRQVIMDQARLLGLEPKELHVSGTIEHEHYDAGPTLAELLNEWREAGILTPATPPASTTVARLDHPAVTP
jgi:hypothetical protein